MIAPDRHLAHFNWATLRAPEGDPAVAEFFDAVWRVNAIAERSPGFVWRNGREVQDARAAGWSRFVDEPRRIASFSVWQTPEAFRSFVYKTLHGAFYRRGREWFAEGQGPNYALWWVPVGQIPTIQEARDRVEQLCAEGPGDDVFTLEAVAETT